MNRIVLFIALTASAGIALAQTAMTTGNSDSPRADRHAKAEARFNDADSNHDGKISFEEMQAAEQHRLRERFDKLDANHDGGVSMDEMRLAHQHRGEMREQRREHWQGMREKLRSLDTDHDQALTKQELGDAMPRLAENFDRLDANHDGKLTRDEIHAMHRMKGQQSPGNH